MRHLVVQLLSHVQLFAIPWAAADRASVSFTISQSLLKVMSIESVIPSNHLILCLLNFIELYFSLLNFTLCQVLEYIASVISYRPLSMGFSRQEYCSGLPCPPLGDLPDPGIEPMSLTSPALQAGSLPISPPGKPRKAQILQFVLSIDWMRPTHIIASHLL